MRLCDFDVDGAFITFPLGCRLKSGDIDGVTLPDVFARRHHAVVEFDRLFSGVVGLCVKTDRVCTGFEEDRMGGNDLTEPSPPLIRKDAKRIISDKGLFFIDADRFGFPGFAAHITGGIFKPPALKSQFKRTVGKQIAPSAAIGQPQTILSPEIIFSHFGEITVGSRIGCFICNSDHARIQFIPERICLARRDNGDPQRIVTAGIRGGNTRRFKERD